MESFLQNNISQFVLKCTKFLLPVHFKYEVYQFTFSESLRKSLSGGQRYSRFVQPTLISELTKRV